MDGEEQSKRLSSRSRRPPAKTPEGREKQLINLAVDLAEEQLRTGRASAQVITHYLKMGSSREALEQEHLKSKTEMEKAKREAMASAAKVEELYEAAIGAMRAYSGAAPLNQEQDEEMD